ncbi:methyltransferase domain-containing protein [Candidatus Woesearchaeota archaeon]|nr:methyltransferase domain-containing protein [Candidatus Woesearchaeota archaeon]
MHEDEIEGLIGDFNKSFNKGEDVVPSVIELTHLKVSLARNEGKTALYDLALGLDEGHPGEVLQDKKEDLLEAIGIIKRINKVNKELKKLFEKELRFERDEVEELGGISTEIKESEEELVGYYNRNYNRISLSEAERELLKKASGLAEDEEKERKTILGVIASVKSVHDSIESFDNAIKNQLSFGKAALKSGEAIKDALEKKKKEHGKDITRIKKGVEEILKSMKLELDFYKEYYANDSLMKKAVRQFRTEEEIRKVKEEIVERDSSMMEKKRLRILLVPCSWGFGPVSKGISLINAIHDIDSVIEEVGVAAAPEFCEFAKRAHTQIKTYELEKEEIYDRPYTDKINYTTFVARFIERLEKVFKEFKPNLVIDSLGYLGGVIANLHGIKVVRIDHMFPELSRNKDGEKRGIQFFDHYRKLVPQGRIKDFKGILIKYAYLPAFQWLGDVLADYLIVSFFYPMEVTGSVLKYRGDKNVFFVNPCMNNQTRLLMNNICGVKQQMEGVLKRYRRFYGIKSRFTKMVLINTGGLSKEMGAYKKSRDMYFKAITGVAKVISSINAELKNNGSKGMRGIVLVGALGKSNEFKEYMNQNWSKEMKMITVIPGNLKSLNAIRLFLTADVIITNAGQTSISELLTLNKPFLVLPPIHSEQQRNVDFIKRTGIGIPLVGFKNEFFNSNWEALPSFRKTLSLLFNRNYELNLSIKRIQLNLYRLLEDISEILPSILSDILGVSVHGKPERSEMHARREGKREETSTRLSISYLISSMDGFGHISRAVKIINQIGKTRSDVRFEIFAYEKSHQFFRESLKYKNYTLHNFEYLYLSYEGIIQKNISNLEIMKLSKIILIDWIRKFPALMKEIKKDRISRDLDTYCVGLYHASIQPRGSDDPEMLRIKAMDKALVDSLDLYIHTTSNPDLRYSTKTHVVPAPLIVREGVESPVSVKMKLGLLPWKKFIYVTVGGKAAGSICNVYKGRRNYEFLFEAIDKLDPKTIGIDKILVSRVGAPYNFSNPDIIDLEKGIPNGQDYIRAAEIVVGKPGMGTLAECFKFGTPFLMTKWDLNGEESEKIRMIKEATENQQPTIWLRDADHIIEKIALTVKKRHLISDMLTRTSTNGEVVVANIIDKLSRYNGPITKRFYEELLELTPYHKTIGGMFGRTKNLDKESYFKTRIEGIIREALSGLSQNAVLLDVGCNTGYVVNTIAKKGYRAVGIDLSEKHIKMAKSRKYGNTAFYVMDASKLRFKENTFDAVILTEVLEHVDEPETVLRETIRVTKKGGRIIIGIPRDVRVYYEGHKHFFTPESFVSLSSKYSDCIEFRNIPGIERHMQVVVTKTRDINEFMNRKIIYSVRLREIREMSLKDLRDMASTIESIPRGISEDELRRKLMDYKISMVSVLGRPIHRGTHVADPKSMSVEKIKNIDKYDVLYGVAYRINLTDREKLNKGQLRKRLIEYFSKGGKKESIKSRYTQNNKNHNEEKSRPEQKDMDEAMKGEPEADVNIIIKRLKKATEEFMTGKDCLKQEDGLDLKKAKLKELKKELEDIKKSIDGLKPADENENKQAPWLIKNSKAWLDSLIERLRNYTEGTETYALKGDIGDVKSNIKEGLGVAINDLKRYVDLIKNDNQRKRLIQRIKEEAGFEVYFHSSYSSRLNDWHDNKGDATNYIRAVYNLRKPSKGAYSPYMDDIMEKMAGGVPGYDTDFDVVVYGLLPKKTRIKKETGYTRTEWEKEKMEGKWGKLGLKKKKPVFKKEYREEDAYIEPQPLSDLVKTGNDNKAYFVKLTIGAEVRDNSGNPRARWFPSLNIAADENLTKGIVDYLMKNPKDYLDFIKEIVPRSEFPNVNKHMIDKAKLHKSIVFLPSDRIDKTRETMGSNKKLEHWVYVEYGREVSVPDF